MVVGIASFQVLRLFGGVSHNSNQFKQMENVAESNFNPTFRCPKDFRVKLDASRLQTSIRNPKSCIVHEMFGNENAFKIVFT